MIHEIMNGSTGDYLIQSAVLGTVLTKLKVNGGKDITYVPTNGLLSPMQMQNQPGSNPASYMVWVSRDPLGIQENKNGYLYAIDPFGSLVANVQPLSGGPSYIPVFGATYSGLTSNSFINASNFSGGCLFNGRPADCNSVRFQLQKNPFVQLDRNHSLPWTESGANQTPQLASGISEEWRFVQPGKRAPAGAKTRTGYFGEFTFYAHYSFFGGENFFPDPQSPAPLTGAQVDKLGSNLQKFLDDPECGKYIKALLGSLPDDVWKTNKFDGSLMDLFNRIKNRGGFWSGDTGPKALARTDPNTMTTTFHSQRSMPLITGQSWQQFGATALLAHELIHVFTNAPNAGVYGHLQMAQAASAAASSLGLDVKGALMLDFPTTQQYGTGEAYDVALSGYHDRVLAYACRKVKL